ncbi:hypothetical protein GCM10011505_47310 [Tistrella bauzanensis]|uniref:Putative pre-16S rRNA nuclease n=2 Tax=Tistrella bauzanensis TaxID=657419 RepID=A0ABQ1J8C6_9PROT|nr:hypothetical protein GCM10011505_47310 [Tistrella bauzanensis]
MAALDTPVQRQRGGKVAPGMTNRNPAPEADLSPWQLARILPARGRIMGLDVGTKTIGVAVSDERRQVATPLELIRRTKFKIDAVRMVDIVRERAVVAVVIGLPVNMDGTEGPRCQSIRQFRQNLAEHLDLPMLFWDERWSTAAVQRHMIDADLSRKRRAELVDKAAASYILEGALDAMNRPPPIWERDTAPDDPKDAG